MYAHKHTHRAGLLGGGCGSPCKLVRLSKMLSGGQVTEALDLVRSGRHLCLNVCVCVCVCVFVRGSKYMHA